jgi:hypothetical protein
MSHQPDLFGRPAYERRAEIPFGTVFSFGARPLYVVKVYGSDAAAPVIVEELSNIVTLKGQFALWSADGVTRAMRGRR